MDYWCSLLMKMAAEDADHGTVVARSSKSIPLRIRVLCWLVKNAGAITRRNDGTVNRRLANFLERKIPPNQTPRHGVYTKDIVIDKTTGIRVRLFVPDNSANGDYPVVVYFHGGGFCALSAADMAYDTFCRKLAGRLTVAVVSVDYRLAPEHRCPVAYDDCFVALAWLRAQGRDFLPPSADLSRCFLMGDSAGGNIVHHVGCRVAKEEYMGPIKIAGHVLIQPYFGGEERTPAETRLSKGVPLITLEAADWYWRAFLPEGATRDHPAANVMGTDISGLSLPPSLVVVGGLDLLQDWQLRYVEHLQKMGNQADILFYEDAIHAFHVFPGYHLTSRFLRDLAPFLQLRAEVSQKI